MTEFQGQYLTGARLKRVSLRSTPLIDADTVNFASAARAHRMFLGGNASPSHQVDQPWDEAPGWDGIPWDLEEQGTGTPAPCRT